LFQVIDNNKYIYSNLIEVNQDILNQLMKLDINFEGHDVETIQNFIKNKERKPFCVIYDFLDFQRNKVETLEKIAKLKSDENFFKKLRISNDLNEKLRKIRANFDCVKELDMQESNMWRIGLICQKDCFFILTEVLKSLQNNGYEWKIVSSSYKIKGRKKALLSNGNGIKQDPKNVLNFLIQIFQVIYFRMLRCRIIKTSI